MEEYFSEGTIPKEHLIVALHEAIREDRIFPVLFASGLRNVGSDHLLDFLQVYAPAPVERVPVAARGTVESTVRRTKVGETRPAGQAPGAEADSVATPNPDGAPQDGPTAEMVMRKVDDREPLSLYVFKTMSDPFAGRISFSRSFPA